MIISISGNAGSGKTTVAKILANKLNYEFISIGNIRRKIANDLNIDIYQLNNDSIKNTKFDTKVDNFQKLLNYNNNIILDSRLGFYFQPKSDKIFLKVNNNIAAKRRFENQTPSEQYKTIKEALSKIKERDFNDELRYKKLYGISHFNLNNYDLIINTSYSNINEIIEKIYNHIKN